MAQYLEYIDESSQILMREGVRDNAYVKDYALTALGFDGVEGVDWRNEEEDKATLIATLVSAVIEDATPGEVVLTFDNPVKNVVKDDFSLTGKTISDLIIEDNVVSLLVIEDYTYRDTVFELNYTRNIGNILSLIDEPITSNIIATWSQSMELSYTEDINTHATWSNAQKDLILERLEEQYVIDTFGPTGLNKTVCDFFIFLQVSSNAGGTTHSAATWTKSGNTLRWNYGGGNIYTQNNIPAQVSTNVVTVTSTDGFSGLTSINASANGFVGNIWNIPYYMPNLTYINLVGQAGSPWFWKFDGDLTGWQFNDNATIVWLTGNGFTGDLTNTHIPNKITTFYINSNSFSGDAPGFSPSKTVKYCAVDLSNNNFTGIGGSTFDVNLAFIYYHNNWLSSTQITNFIQRLATWFIGKTPVQGFQVKLEGTDNGTLIGGEANSDLIAINSIFTSAGQVFTDSYNSFTRLLTPFDDNYACITVDDGYSEDLNLYNLCKSKGVVFVDYTAALDAVAGITSVQAKQMFDDGNEIAFHPTGTGRTAQQYRDDLAAFNVILNNAGIDDSDQVAWAGGSSDALARQTYAENCRSARSIGLQNSAGLIYKDIDRFEQASLAITKSTVFSTDIKPYIDKALVKKGAISVYGHKPYLSTDNPDDYPSYATPLSLYEEIIDYLLLKGFNIITHKQLNDLIDQV